VYGVEGGTVVGALRDWWWHVERMVAMFGGVWWCLVRLGCTMDVEVLEETTFGNHGGRCHGWRCCKDG